MFYNYAELEGGTQVAFSNVLDGGEVQISIERPVDLGFDSALCTLPAFEWSEIEGFDAVSYTHLDVYKRQKFTRRRVDWTRHATHSCRIWRTPMTRG